MSDDQKAGEEDKPLMTVSATRGGLLAGAAIACMMLYAIADRGAVQFIRSAGLLALPFFLAAGAGGVVAWVRAKRGIPTALQVRQVAAIVTIVGAVGGAVYFSLYVAGVDLLRWILGGTFPPGTGGAVLVTAFAAVAGLTLFWFRLRMRLLYGVSEVAAGLSITAWRGFSQAGTAVPSSPEFYVAILTASVYLVVRGFDNVHQGIQSGSDSSLGLIRRFVSGGGITVSVRRLK